jgi:hypothetical protein
MLLPGLTKQVALMELKGERWLQTKARSHQRSSSIMPKHFGGSQPAPNRPWLLGSLSQDVWTNMQLILCCLAFGRCGPFLVCSSASRGSHPNITATGSEKRSSAACTISSTSPWSVNLEKPLIKKAIRWGCGSRSSVRSLSLAALGSPRIAGKC